MKALIAKDTKSDMILYLARLFLLQSWREEESHSRLNNLLLMTRTKLFSLDVTLFSFDMNVHIVKKELLVLEFLRPMVVAYLYPR